MAKSSTDDAELRRASTAVATSGCVGTRTTSSTLSVGDLASGTGFFQATEMVSGLCVKGGECWRQS
jgi:hypothetical protein